MKLLEFLNPSLTWRSLVILGIVASLAMGMLLWLWDLHGHREIESKLRVGLTESEIIRLLGEKPDHTYDRVSAPTDYYVKSYSRKVRPITDRVLIFILGQPIVYVWFDGAGRVEDYFVGGI